MPVLVITVHLLIATGLVFPVSALPLFPVSVVVPALDITITVAVYIIGLI